MATILTQRLQAAHASEIAKHCDIAGEMRVVNRYHFVQQQIVAAGDDEHRLRDRRAVGRFGIIKCVGFNPLLDQMFGKQPFAGDLGCRQSFFGNKAVNHFLVDV